MLTTMVTLYFLTFPWSCYRPHKSPPSWGRCRAPPGWRSSHPGSCSRSWHPWRWPPRRRPHRHSLTCDGYSPSPRPTSEKYFQKCSTFAIKIQGVPSGWLLVFVDIITKVPSQYYWLLLNLNATFNLLSTKASDQPDGPRAVKRSLIFPKDQRSRSIDWSM